jgi:hypothetical protein
MPKWQASPEGVKFEFTSLEDFLSYVNLSVVPVAEQYGYRLTLEPRPKDEPQVGRA